MTRFSDKQFLSSVWLCIPLLAIGSLNPALAETEMDRCYKSDIDYLDNPNLTQAERLEAMNAAFFDSINRFEECILSTNVSSSNASSAAGGGAAAGSGAEAAAGTITGDENSETDMENNAAANSVAASGMSGTETEPMDAAALARQLEQLEQTEAMESESMDGEAVATKSPPGSGRAPEDIPPAANDDAVAAQIRLAAEVETDPDKKAKLWNEYRKYKGIPVKEDE